MPKALHRTQDRIHLILLATQKFNYLNSHLVLFLIKIKYLTAILRPNVRTYAIGLSRIVYLEKQTTQRIVSYNLSIVLHPHGFNMMGTMCLHIGINRIFLRSTNIPH